MTEREADLATDLFGPDPEELPGRWTTDDCGRFPECPRCPGCLGLGHWRFDPRLPLEPRPTCGGGTS